MAFEVIRLWGPTWTVLSVGQQIYAEPSRWPLEPSPTTPSCLSSTLFPSDFPSLILQLAQPTRHHPKNLHYFPPLQNPRFAGRALWSRNTGGCFYHFSGCFRQPLFSCSLLLNCIIAGHRWLMANKIPSEWLQPGLVGSDIVSRGQTLKWQVLDVP